MADSKISALTAVPTAALTDELPINQGGTNYKTTAQKLADLSVGEAFPWAGKIAGAYGDGNPQVLLAGINAQWVAPVNPTPTNITTSVARISYFMLPFDLTVNKIGVLVQLQTYIAWLFTNTLTYPD